MATSLVRLAIGRRDETRNELMASRTRQEIIGRLSAAPSRSPILDVVRPSAIDTSIGRLKFSSRVLVA